MEKVLATGRFGADKAVVSVRTKTLRVLSHDADLEVLRMLVDRRDGLTKTKVQAAHGLQLIDSSHPRQDEAFAAVPALVAAQKAARANREANAVRAEAA